MNRFGWSWSFFALLFALNCPAKPVEKYVTAPFFDIELMSTSDVDDLFAPCPRYALHSPRQLVAAGGWTGEGDFGASLRIARSSNSIFFRFDITDDFWVAAAKDAEGKRPGDVIKIILRGHTAGPFGYSKGTRQTWSLKLQPNPDNDECDLSIEADPGIDVAKLGKPEVKLFRITGTPDEYSLIVRLPHGAWADPPRIGRFLKLQVLFDDADPEGNGNHRFALFVRGKGSGDAGSYLGAIHFAEKVWVNFMPAKLVVAGTKVSLNVRSGNLTVDEQMAEFYLEGYRSRKRIEGFSQELALPPNKVEGERQIELDLSTVKAGLYRLKARAGIYHDPGSQAMQFSPEMKRVLFNALVETKADERVPRRRPLAILQDAEKAKETFRYMAGGGKVLWSVGQYDASFSEFAQDNWGVWPQGRVLLDVPKATAADVPWALFGGKNNLDGYGEPLVLKFSREIFQGKNAMAPWVPDFEHLRKNREMLRLKRASRRLLLLGLIVDQDAGGQFPEIKVASVETGETILAQQVLRPSADQPAGSPHVYVLRLWLTSHDRLLKIENTSAYGNKIKIDFMALLAGGEPALYAANRPSLLFAGSPEADVFSHQVATSLHFLQNYTIDLNGESYSNLPGGRQTGFNPRDYGLLMSELSAWGCLTEARRLFARIPYLPRKLRGGYARNLSIASSVILSGMCNAWRKLNEDRGLIAPLWLPSVYQPAQRMAREIESHPLGLVNGYGEFGTLDLASQACTVPMYFASQAALLNAARASAARGEVRNVSAWEQASTTFYNSYRRTLISPEGRVKVQDIEQGIAAVEIPEDVWIYGRDVNLRTIASNGERRVFNTPYLLSGMFYWIDHSGFQLDRKYAPQLQASFNYLINFAPMCQNSTFREYKVLNFQPSAGQLWVALAALLLDDSRTATEMLVGHIRYTYDELTPIPAADGAAADAEISPYTIEERLHVGPEGENKGASGGDLNVLGGVSALRLARVIGGIDDYQPELLKLLPRLPDGWSGIEAKDWLVSHDFPATKTSVIDYSYSRIGDSRFALSMQSKVPFKQVKVRLGPFSFKTQRVNLLTAGSRESAPTVRIGMATWVEKTFRDVQKLEVSAQAEID